MPCKENEETMTNVTIRIPVSLRAWLDEQAAADYRLTTQYIRALLERTREATEGGSRA